MVGLAGGTLPVPIGPHALESRQIRGTYVGNSRQMEEMAKLVGENKVCVSNTLSTFGGYVAAIFLLYGNSRTEPGMMCNAGLKCVFVYLLHST